MRDRPENWVDKKINMLSILSVFSEYKGGKKVKHFSCICDCGKNTKPIAEKVMRGITTSCGCYGILRRKEKVTRHGLYKSPLYKVHGSMLSRCYNNKNKAYHRYGGRGILVSKDWHIFENFYRDMIDGYSSGLQLNRVDNDKSYYKENCRWVTAKQNMWNRFPKKRKTSSKYIGVQYNKKTNKWLAVLGGKYKGTFDYEKEAAIKYDQECLKERGNFAILNRDRFPGDF